MHENFHAVYDDMKEYLENIQVIKVQNTRNGEILLLTKDKSLLLASTDKDGKITIRPLHDSRADVNVYDMRLKHNVFCETEEYLTWIGLDYKILSYDKGKALQSKPVDFIRKKIMATEDDLFTCAFGADKLLWLGDKNGHFYSIDPQSGLVNKYVLPEITHAIKNLLVTESGMVYLSVAGQGVYEYNLGYKQLQKLTLSVPEVDVTHSFVDKYDKIWFVLGERGVIYYDPLNKNNQYYSFPKGANICEFGVQDAGEQGIFFLTPGEKF